MAAGGTGPVGLTFPAVWGDPGSRASSPTPRRSLTGRRFTTTSPFPQEALVYAERGFRTNAEQIAKLAQDNDYTLRQTVEFLSAPRPSPFAGSPVTVADQIQQWFEARALDGLNYHIGHPSQWHRFREEVVPILRERGIVRTEYEAATLRGNLGLPVPENRYTRVRRKADSLLKI